MRYALVLVLAGLLPAPQAARPSTAAAEQEVREFEQKYNAAYAANDLPAESKTDGRGIR